MIVRASQGLLRRKIHSEGLKGTRSVARKMKVQSGKDCDFPESPIIIFVDNDVRGFRRDSVLDNPTEEINHLADGIQCVRRNHIC